MILHPQTTQAYELFHNGILALARAEQQGIRIDVDYCERKRQHLQRRIEKLKKQFCDTDFFRQWQKSSKSKVNINSDPQLRAFLFNVKKLTTANKTESGALSVNETTLRSFNIPELDILLQIRKLDKLTSYIDLFYNEQVDGYMHPFFNLHLARTFRSSSSNPNFQNIPVRDEEAMNICRGAIFPRPGHRLIEVDYSGIEVRLSACVTGDSKVETIDGTKSILQIIKDVEDQKIVYVYGYNFDQKRIGISKVTDGGLTKKNAEIWELTLDSGEVVKATKDHRFLLRNGEYCELQYLKKGDSLMPFYKKRKKSNYGTVYEHIYLNNGENITAHNLIAEDVRGITIKGSKMVVHHKNGNGCDNSLENTEVLTRVDHMRIHAVQGWKNNPQSRTVGSWMKTEAGRNFAKGVNKKRKEEWTVLDWQEFGSRVKEGLQKSGTREKERNSMFGKKQTEETKRKISEAKKGKSIGSSWNKGLTKLTSSIVAKISKSKIGKPSGRKGETGIYHTTEETKQKIREKLKGRVFSNEQRKKLSEAGKLRWVREKENGMHEVCKICDKTFVSLSSTHLRYSHNISKKEYKETYNHKVKSIEFKGYEDVYNLNVEGFHNYALSAGVISKNCYNKDPMLIKYINDPTTDMHGDMAAQIFFIDNFSKKIPAHAILRSAAKNGFVFPEFYGDYYKNCAANLACEWGKLPKAGKWKPHQGILLEGMGDGNYYLSDHLAKHGITELGDTVKKNGRWETTGFTKHLKDVEADFWGNRFKVYAEWKDQFYAEYLKNGYVDLLTGFRCSGVMDKKNVINYPVQGAAFHCLLRSFIEIDRISIAEKWDTRLVGQIHDSMVLDVNVDEFDYVVKTIQEVNCKRLLEFFPWIIVPMEVEVKARGVDESWAEKETIIK